MTGVAVVPVGVECFFLLKYYIIVFTQVDPFLMPNQSAVLITMGYGVHPLVYSGGFGRVSAKSYGRVSSPCVRREERSAPNNIPTAGHAPNVQGVNIFILEFYFCEGNYCHFPHDSMECHEASRHDLTIGRYA